MNSSINSNSSDEFLIEKNSLAFSSKDRFALIDCNNFYASCERVFNPKLEGKPLIVLSGNDGCVIARSNEAKVLGIQMGQPFFEIKDLVHQHNVIVRSSNFALYADISGRIMSILTAIAPHIEIYSVDEAFLDFSGFSEKEAEKEARQLRLLIKQWVGIPVSIGIATTKTLSKLGNFIAKKKVSYEGVCILPTPPQHLELLKDIPVAHIWGIGRQSDKFLQRNGIWTAYDLAKESHGWIKKQMGVMGLRIALELQGISCLSLDESPSPQKSLVVSRSFGYRITHYQELSQAVALYAHKASEKLRNEKLLARQGYLFLQTKIGPGKNYRTETIPLSFPHYFNNSFELIGATQAALKTLYRPGTSYKKAGIILFDLLPETMRQTSLFYATENLKFKKLTKIMDEVNQKFGKETLFSASVGTQRKCQSQSSLRSPRYTTEWTELPVAKAV